MSETRTWEQAKLDAEAAALDAWVDAVADDEVDTIDGGDAAAEYADACGDVIYTWRSRSIWIDSTTVQDYEDDIDGMDEELTIDRRITLCVYLALRDAYRSAWEELAGNEVLPYALVHIGSGQYVSLGEEEDMEETRVAQTSPNEYVVVPVDDKIRRMWALDEGPRIINLRERVRLAYGDPMGEEA